MEKEKIMKFLGKGLGTASSVSGFTGSTLGVIGATMDADTEKGRKTAGNLGIASGAFNTTSGVLDLFGAGKDLYETFSDKKKTGTEKGLEATQAGLGGLGGLFSIGGGIADIFAGAGQKKNDSEMEKRAGIASGAFGLLGGLTGMAQGGIGIGKAIGDYKKAKVSTDQKEKDGAKRNLISGLISSGGSALSGLLGTISGGLGIWGSVKDNKAAKAGSKWAAGLGAGASTLGAIGNIADWFSD